MAAWMDGWLPGWLAARLQGAAAANQRSLAR